jgi:signal transduction histidine kinase
MQFEAYKFEVDLKATASSHILSSMHHETYQNSVTDNREHAKESLLLSIKLQKIYFNGKSCILALIHDQTLEAKMQKYESRREIQEKLTSQIIENTQTPLHIIRVASEFLNGQSNSSSQHVAFQRINSAVAYLFAQVNNLLDFNLIRENRFVL